MNFRAHTIGRRHAPLKWPQSGQSAPTAAPNKPPNGPANSIAHSFDWRSQFAAQSKVRTHNCQRETRAGNGPAATSCPLVLCGAPSASPRGTVCSLQPHGPAQLSSAQFPSAWRPLSTAPLLPARSWRRSVAWTARRSQWSVQLANWCTSLSLARRANIEHRLARCCSQFAARSLAAQYEQILRATHSSWLAAAFQPQDGCG